MRPVPRVSAVSPHVLALLTVVVCPRCTANLKFTFKPPPVEDRAAGGGNNLGQWTMTTARVVLRGGFCSPGVPEVQVVPILLKGFVPL